jgi:D-alanyl-D-alanine carboxypeptidase
MTDSARPAAQVYRRRRLVVAGVAVLLVAGVGIALALVLAPKGSPVVTEPRATQTMTPSPPPSATPTPTPTAPVFDKAKHSIDDPMSIWVVVDKLRPLNPLDFTPSDLVTAAVPYSANATMRAEAAGALEQMFAAAAAEGAGGMMVQNAFRPYSTQVSLYAGHVQRLGQAEADIASARPGHSEHQTGLTADIMPDNGQCGVADCFAQTSQGIWLAENAWRFGYHLRYPQGKTDVTGYKFEPWHYRYVGIELSTELHQQGVTTLEEFFGLPAAPTYG